MWDEIEVRELKKSAVVKELHSLPGHLSEVFKGKHSISAMTAVKLEKMLGVSAEFWLGLQSDFDLAQAQRILAA